MNRLALRTATVAAALFLTLGAAAFATGQREGTSQRAPGTAGAEKIESITGNVYLANLIHPVLKSGSSEVELLVPRYAVYESGVKEGQNVTVKGYKVDASRLGPWHNFGNNQDNATYFFVTGAVIGGKEYNLADFRPGFGYGPRAGRGYGPGFGPGYGPQAGRGAMGFYGRPFGMMGYGPAGPHGFYGDHGFRGMPGYGPGMWYRFHQASPQGQSPAPNSQSNQ